MQAPDLEKLFSIHKAGKGLVYRIYKVHLKIKKKITHAKMPQNTEKWVKDLNKLFHIILNKSSS